MRVSVPCGYPGRDVSDLQSAPRDGERLDGAVCLAHFLCTWVHLLKHASQLRGGRFQLSGCVAPCIVSEKDFALADGLTHSEFQGLNRALSDQQKSKIVSAETLAVAWLETRTEEEMKLYPSIVEIAHDIIEEGFSNTVITPGETTVEEVEWWYRDRIEWIWLHGCSSCIIIIWCVLWCWRALVVI